MSNVESSKTQAETIGAPRGLAIIAVAFDKETPALTESALSLARKTGVALRFVHVLENAIPEGLLVDAPLYNIAPVLLRESQAQIRQEKDKAMQELKATIPQDVTSSFALLEGEAVPAIIQDATAHGANLVMTACNPDQYGALMPHSFSVALRLMAEAPLPVIVTNSANPINFSSKHFSMLLADDLQPASEEAARKAFELAVNLPGSRVRHLHVHGDFRELLRHMWLDLKTRHPVLQKAGESPEDTLKREYEARVAALQNRGGHYRKAACDKGSCVEPDVRTGDVHEILDDEIADVDPNLIVFGRHRTLKAKPFLIGRISLRAMLHAKRPIVVVPPHDELYAPMPFPG